MPLRKADICPFTVQLGISLLSSELEKRDLVLTSIGDLPYGSLIQWSIATIYKVSERVAEGLEGKELSSTTTKPKEENAELTEIKENEIPPTKEPEPKITGKILEDKHDRRAAELENEKRRIVNEFRKTRNSSLLGDLDNTLMKLHDAELEQVKEFRRRGLISDEDFKKQEKHLDERVKETVNRQNRHAQGIIVPVEEYKEIFESVPVEEKLYCGLDIGEVIGTEAKRYWKSLKSVYDAWKAMRAEEKAKKAEEEYWYNFILNLAGGQGFKGIEVRVERNGIGPKIEYKKDGTIKILPILEIGKYFMSNLQPLQVVWRDFLEKYLTEVICHEGGHIRPEVFYMGDGHTKLVSADEIENKESTLRKERFDLEEKSKEGTISDDERIRLEKLGWYRGGFFSDSRVSATKADTYAIFKLGDYASFATKSVV